MVLTCHLLTCYHVHLAAIVKFANLTMLDSAGRNLKSSVLPTMESIAGVQAQSKTNMLPAVRTAHSNLASYLLIFRCVTVSILFKRILLDLQQAK